MQAKLIGKMKLEFQNREGDVIKGINLFVAFADPNVEGLRCEKFFVKDGIPLPDQLKVNDTIDLGFDYKGKIEYIDKL